MKKKIGFGLVIVALIMAVYLTYQSWQRQQALKHFTHSNVPTLFFHGGGSSYHAEEHMVGAAKKAGASAGSIIAFVDKNGQVTLRGHFKNNSQNPIVMVNFENSTNFNFADRGRYATNVVKALRKEYKFSKVNMVGHSAGNIAIVYYMLQNGGNQDMPQLQKYVAIAGHFAGLNFKEIPDAIKQPAGLTLDSQGKPNKMNATYQEMTQLRKTYPAHQTQVLNIIGDIGGHTDGTVPNVSSLSLKYLIANRAKSYEEKTFKGRGAKHSALHNNAKVDKTLIAYLWSK
ncbi:alpha/beta hydrolase [Streptococcus caballi]|uniref:alpha/beta hydrolase n=1 Tax=Streptococcus caballi TaxID=439220 RepID=UPI00036FD095|nr:alpha/beta hydrolase [Streptococcus caballi]